VVRRRVRPAPEGCGGSPRWCGATVGAVRGGLWCSTPQVWCRTGRCWCSPFPAFAACPEVPSAAAHAPRAPVGACDPRSCRPWWSSRAYSTGAPRTASLKGVRGPLPRREEYTQHRVGTRIPGRDRVGTRSLGSAPPARRVHGGTGAGSPPSRRGPPAGGRYAVRRTSGTPPGGSAAEGGGAPH